MTVIPETPGAEAGLEPEPLYDGPGFKLTSEDEGLLDNPLEQGSPVMQVEPNDYYNAFEDSAYELSDYDRQAYQNVLDGASAPSASFQDYQNVDYSASFSSSEKVVNQEPTSDFSSFWAEDPASKPANMDPFGFKLVEEDHGIYMESAEIM